MSRLGIAASFAGTETRIFATDEIDTSLAEAFIVRRTRLTVRIDALARTIAYLQAKARRRVVRLLRRNVGARADAAGNRARLAFTGATIVAAHAVHTESKRALIVSGAQAALHEFRRAHVHEQIAIIVGRALRIVRARVQAGARITRERAATHIAAVDTNARAIASIRIDLGIARARGALTNGAVGVERARTGAIACTGFTARTCGLLIAFVLRVLTVDDRPALAIDAATLQHGRAGLAQPRANVVATHAVDTEAAGALIGRRTRRPQIDLALTKAVASSGIAFISGIGIGRDTHATADAIGYVASLTGSRTGLIAANAIDTAVRGALRIHHAGLPIGQLTSTNAVA